MIFEITPHVIVSAASTAILLFIALIAWQRRATPGAKALLALMVAASVWAGLGTLEYAIVGLPAKIVLVKLRYAGVLSVPVFFLQLALSYTRAERWSGRRLAYWFIVPLLNWLLVLTNDWHHLIWTEYQLVSPNLAMGARGPVYWLGPGYSYLVMLLGVVVLVRASWHAPAFYGRQTLTLLAGVAIPWLGNVLYVLGFGPVPGLDPTAALMSLFGAVLAWGLFRQRWLELSPLARHTMVEHLPDAMLVLDWQERLVDLNPAARRLLAAPPAVLGRAAAEYLAAYPAALAAIRAHAEAEVEISRAVDGQPRHYSVWFLPIFDPRRRYTGQVIIWREVTLVKQAQAALHRASVLEERSRLARDLHDDLGQVLGFVNLQAQATRKFLADDAVDLADQRLERMVTIVEETQINLREQIARLKAPAAPAPFLQALTKVVEHFKRAYGLPVEVHWPPAAPAGGFAPALDAHLLALLQEALTNAGKHAGAHTVQLRFTLQAGWVEMTLTDDGCGFDLARSGQQANHFGLPFMQERAQEAGGHVRIQTAPGQGVQVIVRLPWQTGGGPSNGDWP